MGFGDLDQFDLYRNTRYALPKDIAAKFTHGDEIKSRLAKGENHFDLSILKWERLDAILDFIAKKTSKHKYLHNFKGRIGYKSCALCITSISRYEAMHGKMKSKEQKCTVCSLAKLDCCLEKKSAYGTVDRVLRRFYDGQVLEKDQETAFADLRGGVKRMIDNLKILKKGEKVPADKIDPTPKIGPIAAPKARVRPTQPAPTPSAAKENLPLPEEILGKLLTPKDIAKRLLNGEDPTAVTFLKWKRFEEALRYVRNETEPERFANNLRGKTGFSVTALCTASTKKFGELYGAVRNPQDKCKVCPLAQIDPCLKSGSAYDEINSVLVGWREKKLTKENITSELKKLGDNVQRMLVNLRAISAKPHKNAAAEATEKKVANESNGPDLKILAAGELPETIKKKFLTGRDVAAALAEGENPIDVTLLKWQRLNEILEYILKKSKPEKYLINFKDKMGNDTSALCIASIKKYSALYGEIQRRDDKCTVCPLAKIERCIDRDSTYYNIDKTLHKYYEPDYDPISAETDLEQLRKNMTTLVSNLQSLSDAHKP